MLLALQEVLGVPARALSIKSRERQRGNKQYTVEDDLGKFFTVREGAREAVCEPNRLSRHRAVP
jgi:hypothetical protein